MDRDKNIKKTVFKMLAILARILLVVFLAFPAFFLGSRFREAWPASVMLGIGVMFLLAVFTRKKLPAGQ